MAPSTTSDSIANSDEIVPKKTVLSISSSIKVNGPVPNAFSNSLMQIQTASYPTRSLEFLRKLEQADTSQGLHNGAPYLNGVTKPSPLLFKVIVVGAGLGGLATAIALARKGHVVTVLEQAPALGEVGFFSLCFKLSGIKSNTISIGWSWYPSSAQFCQAALKMGAGATARG